MDGTVYMLNNSEKKVKLKVSLNVLNVRPPDQESLDKKAYNCVFHIGPYSQFDIDRNPILVVHD